MTLSKNEVQVAASLLELASERFGNHGCNDFDLESLIPDDHERTEFVRALHRWNGDVDEGELYGWFDPDSTKIVMDWFLMDFLVARLRGEV